MMPESLHAYSAVMGSLEVVVVVPVVQPRSCRRRRQSMAPGQEADSSRVTQGVGLACLTLAPLRPRLALPPGDGQAPPVPARRLIATVS